MTDDRFEDFVQREGASYHAPPDTPRDEMWARIDEARRARRGRPAAAVPSWVRWGVGVAAVLAVGVGIGRLTAPRGVGPEGSVGGTTAAAMESTADTGMTQLVAGDYLSGADAFIALFQAEARAGLADEQVGEWARDLLVTTRILLDSPYLEGNVVFESLLQDIEVILVQIAQYAASQDLTELEFIERGLETRSVQFRIQAALSETSGPQGAL